jgi:CheY-like chemotaxis protein
VCEPVAKVLRKEGYEPLMAAGGIEAFELYKRRLPDLVLLDLNMPRQNGWALLKKLANSIRLPRLSSSLVGRISLDCLRSRASGP